MTKSCCSSSPETPEASPYASRRWAAGTGIGLAAWAGLYAGLKPFAERAVAWLGLVPGEPFTEAAAFFLYDAPKVLLLLGLVVFLMGIARSFLSPQRARRLLVRKQGLASHLLAASFGIVTPFCSCSAVSLFVGFVSAGIPLGLALSFLIAAPMINEVALGLLLALMGWKVAGAYLVFGLLLATFAGWIMGKFHLEGALEPWVREARAQADEALPSRLTLADRLRGAWASTRDIVGAVWIWVVAGIAVGAFIHGYAPAEDLARIMGRDNWWSVPAAVLVGVPLYANAAGIIPVVEALLNKGAALGTALAFMMSVTALSLPEAIILRRVLSWRLLAVFFAIVATGILVVGYLFNLLV